MSALGIVQGTVRPMRLKAVRLVDGWTVVNAASQVLAGPEAKITDAPDTVIGWVRDALYAAKICSYAQGFGLMPLEAMAMGCTVVGFDGYGGRDYMRPDINCCVVPYPDIDGSPRQHRNGSRTASVSGVIARS